MLQRNRQAAAAYADYTFTAEPGILQPSRETAWSDSTFTGQ